MKTNFGFRDRPVLLTPRYDLERMFAGMFLIKRVGKGGKKKRGGGLEDGKALLYLLLFIFAKPAG